MYKTLIIWSLAALTLLIHLNLANAQGYAELSKLEKQIAEVVKEHKSASISYSIVQQGELVHQTALGFADLKARKAATINTPYRIASVSKMVVGIAIMQLVGSGNLSLDDELSTLLPDLAFDNPWHESHPLRLVHLLEHTTGWNDISLWEFAYNNEPQLSLQAALALNPDSRQSRWAPGTRYGYTNSTATVAALIVERKTGMAFADYAQQFIFAPLGITSASYSNFPQQVAKGYGGGDREVAYKPVLMTPAGGLVISLQDLSKLMQAMIIRNPALLSHEGYQRIEQSHSTNAGVFDAGYGLFNYARFYQGIAFRGHDGAFPVWRAELSYSVAHQAGFVVLQNSGNDRAFRAVVKLISDYLIKEFKPAQLAEVTALDNAAEITGYYRAQNPRNQKRFFLERLISSNKLTQQGNEFLFSGLFPPGWQRKLSYVGHGQWQNEQGEVVMKQAQDPQLGAVVHYGDRVFVKESAFSAWSDKLVLLFWLLCLLLFLPLLVVWSVRLKKQRYEAKAEGNLRLALIVSGSVSWSFIVFLVLGMLSPINRLGGPGLFSIGLMLSSIALAIVTFWAAFNYARSFKQIAGSITKSFATVFFLVQILVVLYLARFGGIGLISWT